MANEIFLRSGRDAALDFAGGGGVGVGVELGWCVNILLRIFMKKMKYVFG